MHIFLHALINNNNYYYYYKCYNIIINYTYNN